MVIHGSIAPVLHLNHHCEAAAGLRFTIQADAKPPEPSAALGSGGLASAVQPTKTAIPVLGGNSVARCATDLA